MRILKNYFSPSRLVYAWSALIGLLSRRKWIKAAIKENPDRIVFIRLDGLGDMVLTVPLIRSARAAFPDARLEMVCLPVPADFLRHCPYLDNVVSLDLKKEPINYYAANWSEAFSWHRRQQQKMLRVMRNHSLRDSSCKKQWVLQCRADRDDYGANHLALLLGGDQIFGIKETFSEKKALANSGWGDFCSRVVTCSDNLHEIARNEDWAETLGMKRPELDLEVWWDNEEQKELAQWDELPSLVALGIGAASANRCWSLGFYAELAQRLRARGYAVVPIGTRREIKKAADMEGLIGKEGSLGGRPIPEVACFLARCRLFIGNDSGPAHVAAASGCTTIVLSGLGASAPANHSSSPDRFAPWGRGHLVLRSENTSNEFSMHEIPVELVLKEALLRLEAK